MVSRKAHNLKTVVRFDLPQPRKENLKKLLQKGLINDIIL